MRDAADRYDFPRLGAILRPQLDPSEWRANVTQHSGADGTALNALDARALSAGEVEGRRQIVEYMRFLTDRRAGAAGGHRQRTEVEQRAPIHRQGAGAVAADSQSSAAEVRVARTDRQPTRRGDEVAANLHQGLHGRWRQNDGIGANNGGEIEWLCGLGHVGPVG